MTDGTRSRPDRSEPATSPSWPGESIALRALLTIAYAIASLTVLNAAFEVGELDANARSTFHDLAWGRAYRPFQYRLLVPLAARALAWMVPSTLVAELPSFLRGPVARLGGDALGLAGVMIMVASLISWIASFHTLAGRVLPRASPSTHHVVTLGALLGLVPFLFWGYVYDLTTLLLFTLATLALSCGRFRRFVLVFVLTTLSRETALLLVLPAVFALRGWRERCMTAFSLLTLYAAIETPIHFAFRRAPGALIEDHLAGNLAELASNPACFAIAAAFLGFGVWRVCIAFRTLGGAMRGHVLAFPPLALAALYGGMLGEVRVFLEAYPAIVLAVCASFASPSRVQDPAQPAAKK